MKNGFWVWISHKILKVIFPEITTPCNQADIFCPEITIPQKSALKNASIQLIFRTRMVFVGRENLLLCSIRQSSHKLQADSHKI